MTVATIALFLACAGVTAYAWNRWFDAVPLRIIILFIAIVCAYESTTLFTSRVDLPGNLAFVTFPWSATGGRPSAANTGIVFQQIAPWTRVARDAVRSGEWPLWNRYSASGAPLLANQQTAIFHPFTLIGFLLLSIGKGFTFTASMRLFVLLFFTFVFLRGHSLNETAAIYGAVAYAFSTFHVVWLLFPHGLASMMLPIALAGAQNIAREGTLRSFFLLAGGLALSVLGGHPESAFWVWMLTAAYSAFLMFQTFLHLAAAATAFVVAGGLTAFAWMPTVGLLPTQDRTLIMHSPLHNPPNHNLGPEWRETLLAPNLFGTPQTRSWTAPRRRHPTVLDDYGEISSGYAGIVTLALAICAPIAARRREVWFFAAVMLAVFATIAELPLWREAIRAIPIVGLTMHQRLRLFWCLGAVALAAFTIDRRPKESLVRSAIAIVWSIVATIHVIRAPDAEVAWTTFIVSSTAALIFFVFPRVAPLAIMVTLAELLFITYRYNPSAAAANALPMTNAIREMQVLTQTAAEPARMVALGWTFLPDTPSFYGLEDVKSTDPISHAIYKRLMRGFLHVVPSYDDIVPTIEEPFADFLNIRYVYAPPKSSLPAERFTLRYSGSDGEVYENIRSMPRYFVPTRYRVNTAIYHAIPTLKEIRDFTNDVVIDHVPSRIAEQAPQLAAHSVDEWRPSAAGRVTVLSYRNNSTLLEVENAGWSVLASSDTHWPGWRSYVNGVRQPPITINGAFLGCFVPPGRHRVEFRYRPAEFDVGLRVTIATIIALIGGLLAWWRAGRFRHGPM
ncbi:MAG TPA: YfhO family protein [Thermoanaerobaculia bacterium]